MKLAEQTCTQFTELIASKAPAPGGGGASALVAAIGIALGDMVGEFTVGKRTYAEVEPHMLSLMERSQALRVRLLELVDEDAENFLPLSQAYGIPKDDPTRDSVMEEALRLAIKAPLEILEISCETIGLQKDYASMGSKIMISDAATGAACAWAAISGAAINIKVNTKLMKDRDYADAINSHVDEMLEKYQQLAESVYRYVYDTMK